MVPNFYNGTAIYMATQTVTRGTRGNALYKSNADTKKPKMTILNKS